MKSRILIIALGSGRPSPHEGRFLKAYDPEYGNGRGLIVSTDKAERAMLFDNPAAAIALWRAVPANHPTRTGFDDKPNRPFTAYTIAIESVPDA